jgi:iron complex transport system substrate-binding protein
MIRIVCLVSTLCAPLLLLLVGGASLAGAPPAAGSLPAATATATVSVIDDRGRPVAFDRPPLRVVALLPSLSETVCALGACERLVGVDNYANWPDRVRSLPRVGGLDDVQVEAVVALQPDLILAATSTRAVPRLEALGLKVMAMEPRTLADLREVVLRLDRVLGTGRGPSLLASLESDLARAARDLPPSARGQRVYFEVADAPFAASESSFIGELLARLGAVNVVPGSLGPFPKLNPEFVVRADPQVILLSAQSAPALRARPGWSGISALRTGRVCPYTPAQGDVLVRPGPRLGEALRLMADCLRSAPGAQATPRTPGAPR